MARVFAFSSNFSRAMRNASVARVEGAHALISNQRLADLGANIFHFTDKREEFRLMRHPSSSVQEAAVPYVVGIASRMVRVAATYIDSFGRVVETATTAGSGLLLGNHVLTAAHVLEPTFMFRGEEVSLYEVRVDPGVNCPLPSMAALAEWFPARLDDCITLELHALSRDVKTMDVDCTVWLHNGDTAVLRLRDGDAAFLNRRAGPLKTPMSECFAPADQARLGKDETHYLLGYPSVPAPDTTEDNAAKLWHGSHPVKSTQLDAFLGTYETLMLSRGTGLPASTSPTGQAPPIGSTNGSATSTKTANMLPHMANALGGMSGGPVLNSSGRIIGMHVGGRESTGAYNVYVGVDHPVMRAAINMMLDT